MEAHTLASPLPQTDILNPPPNTHNARNVGHTTQQQSNHFYDIIENEMGWSNLLLRKQLFKAFDLDGRALHYFFLSASLSAVCRRLSQNPMNISPTSYLKDARVKLNCS